VLSPGARKTKCWLVMLKNREWREKLTGDTSTGFGGVGGYTTGVGAAGEGCWSLASRPGPIIASSNSWPSPLVRTIPVHSLASPDIRAPCPASFPAVDVWTATTSFPRKITPPRLSFFPPLANVIYSPLNGYTYPKSSTRNPGLSFVAYIIDNCSPVAICGKLSSNTADSLWIGSASYTTTALDFGNFRSTPPSLTFTRFSRLSGWK
jgi:hypothetical protein